MSRLLMKCLAVVVLLALVPVHTYAAPEQEELDLYLQEIDWTQKELEEYLETEYGTELSDFEDAEELRIFLGDLLTDESLHELLTDYEMSIEELEQLLKADDKTLADFKFTDDLDFFLFDHMLAELDFEEAEMLYDDYFAEFGLDEDEFWVLYEHFYQVLFTENGDLNEGVLERLEALLERLESFPYFESADDLTAENIAELLSICQELLSIFQLEADFYLTKEEEKLSLTLGDLLSLETTNGYDLLIELYNAEGDFLADIILSAELFAYDSIDQVTGEFNEIKTIVEVSADAGGDRESVSGPAERTETGGRLPETASSYPLQVLIGLAAAVLGGLFYVRVRKTAA
ncbi:processed acidic surface protein [Thalassorhabdus alkalitolerans]|uniref:Processed acidic surface protein n=1 Tax=Thalassorhabdus alkalitolerans TaxID=2282697 RepID=A0ABW0YME2_9BACI